MIDANAKHWYWSSGGNLYRNEAIGPEVIGQVLEGQTLFGLETISVLVFTALEI